MNRTNWLQKVLLLALIWMLLLSTSCAPPTEVVETDLEGDVPTETPVEVANETPEIEPERTPSVPAPRVGNITPGVNGYTFDEEDETCKIEPVILTGIGNATAGYVPNQVTIIGNTGPITDVVDNNYELFLAPSEPVSKISLPNVFGTYGLFEIHLYELADDVSVWDAVEQINQYILGDPADPADDIKYVFAEPNYITALPNSPAAGDTPGTSADPCRGCSGGISGNTTTPGAAVPASPDLIEYAQSEFLNQWAFGGQDQQVGSIGLFGPNHQRVVNHTGENVDVVVFDTVPRALDERIESISWASIPFDICVWRTGLNSSSNEDTYDESSEDPVALQEHGLFVTGLAQGVAPEARYFLVEVLNEQGKGDVNSLVLMIDKFADHRGNLSNTVINLSLGIELEKFPNLLGQDAQNAIATSRALITSFWGIFMEALTGKVVPSVALRLSMYAYTEVGAVIVAASGNDMSNEQQAPAVFSDVLGVASNDIGANWSCFSNAGDLAAPGGNGEGTSCNRNMVALCLDVPYIGNCPHVVISILSDNPALASNVTDRYGFGYWAGTSMSTPLVSGLAALFLEKCPNSLPADVRGILTTSAVNLNQISELGAGVIQVGESMAEACP